MRKLLNINNCGYAFFESVEFVPYIMNVLILSRRFSLNDNDYTFIYLILSFFYCLLQELKSSTLPSI